MSKTHITALEVENLKRIKAVRLEPSATGLTIIGGDNAQGKTSVLDAITYALGGERYKPSNPKRDGSMVDPEIRLTLSNGITVERRGKNGSLKVTDPNNGRSGQQLLNEFVHQFALDLPKFLNSTNAEKAKVLLQVIGVGDKLAELERAEKRDYDERTVAGRIADQKAKYAEEMPYHPDAPSHPVAINDLVAEQQRIAAHNSDNQRKRQSRSEFEQSKSEAAAEVVRLRAALAAAEDRLSQRTAQLVALDKYLLEMEDIDPQPVIDQLAVIESTNAKVRANLDKSKALDDATMHRAQYDALTVKIDATRAAKAALLDGAKLPLPGLSVDQGDLTYNGQRWDCMSGAEQLQVATAIVRALNPQCGFVLLDKLEAMDMRTLETFGKWLAAEGLQAIATRVSTGAECSIIIEDGTSITNTQAAAPVVKTNYTPGEF
jgi:DNA repair exonuclease SbcCD ATPase subunit